MWFASSEEKQLDQRRNLLDGCRPQISPSRDRLCACKSASEAAHQSGVKFLFVATLHPDDPYEPCQRTRRFYESVGFAYVLEEEFLADPNNRIAYYMKDISA